MTAATVHRSCPDRLDQELLARYRAEGFLAFDGFLSAAEVDELRTAMDEVVRRLQEEAQRGAAIVRGRAADDRMRNYQGLLVQSRHDGTGMQFEPDVDVDIVRDPFAALATSYRKLYGFERSGGPLQDVVDHQRLRALVEGIVGSDPILYGSMALAKPARIGVAKPWHQDMAYFSYEPLDGGVHAWIALDAADAENGCMTVLPGAHRGGPMLHVHEDDCRIDGTAGVPVPLQPGGILLFSPMLPHETGPNRSDRRRRSLQLFFRGRHTRVLEPDDYDRLFADAGEAASCRAAARRATAS